MQGAAAAPDCLGYRPEQLGRSMGLTDCVLHVPRLLDIFKLLLAAAHLVVSHTGDERLLACKRQAAVGLSACCGDAGR